MAPYIRTRHGWFERLLLAALLLSICVPAHGQTAGWVKEEKTDLLRDMKCLQFVLGGKFLTPPKKADVNASPSIILQCTPGSFVRGHQQGKLLKGYIYVGAVIDSQVSTLSTSGANVQVKYRLDDGKLQNTLWSHSTDYSSVFFSNTDLNTLLYGHFMPHKENTTPPVKKVVIGLYEYLGGEVVMQFDMPDPSEVVEACGVIWHK